MTKLESTLEGLALRKVKPSVYPGTYAIIPMFSIMAEGVANRSSASWKKAEHIFVDGLQPDGGSGLLPYWREFMASAIDETCNVQKLYIDVGGGKFRRFDANGELSGEGTVSELFTR